MQLAKEKVSNMASAAKEQMDVAKAKKEEKAEKARATTKEEWQIADEREKAKEAQAKAELHAAKARHAAEKLDAKQQRNHVPGLGTYRTGTGTGTSAGDRLPGTGHHNNDQSGRTTYATSKLVVGGVPTAAYTNQPVFGGASAATVPMKATNTGYPLGTVPRGHKYL